MAAGVAALLVLLAPASASAAVSARPDDVVVTVYHLGVGSGDFRNGDDPEEFRSMGLAMVTETRTVDLPAGPSDIRFEGVADTMVSETADVSGLPVPPSERNLDYALLSPGSLLAHSIGQEVGVVTTDPKTGRSTEERARIESAPKGVVLNFGGRIEALHCGGPPQRLVFSRIPEGLSDRAVLSMRTMVPKAGPYQVKLSYLATGLDWSADYVARISPDGRTLDLSGWVTLANFSNTSFPTSPVEVVAGRLQMTGDDQPVEAEVTTTEPACWGGQAVQMERLIVPREVPPPPVAAPNGVQEVVVTGSRIDPRRLGDYKLYALPQPTSFAAHQTKQVQFLDQRGVAFQRLYQASVNVNAGALDPDDSDAPPEAVIRMTNDEKSHLGRPLPAGRLSVVEARSADPAVLIGEGRVRDTPVGVPFELKTGAAMDLTLNRRLVASRKTGWQGKRAQFDIEATAVNAKDASVTLEIFHVQEDSEESVKVVRESARHIEKDGRPLWSLVVPAHSRAVLRYTVEATPDAR